MQQRIQGETDHGSVGRGGAALLTVLVAGLFLAGCAPTAEDTVETAEVLVFERLGMGHSGTVRDTVEAVARSAAEWETLQQAVRPMEPFREVDFTQYMVALVAIPTESGGYIVEVESVEDLDGEINVSYVLNTPQSDCVTLAAEAMPFQAVVIRRADGDVRFTRRIARYSCEM
jgi:hypothetical protein